MVKVDVFGCHRVPWAQASVLDVLVTPACADDSSRPVHVLIAAMQMGCWKLVLPFFREVPSVGQSCCAWWGGLLPIHLLKKRTANPTGCKSRGCFSCHKVELTLGNPCFRTFHRDGLGFVYSFPPCPVLLSPLLLSEEHSACKLLKQGIPLQTFFQGTKLSK